MQALLVVQVVRVGRQRLLQVAMAELVDFIMVVLVGMVKQVVAGIAVVELRK